MITGTKISIIAAFAGAVLCLGLVGTVYWLDTQKAEETEFSLGVCKDKMFSRAELEQFVQACNEEQFCEACGDNIGEIEVQDNGALALVYTYQYPRQKLSDEFCKKYGTGFSVKFLNGQAIDWDVIGLPGAIAVMTPQELDAKLKVGMTAAEIKALWGEPNQISRSKEKTYYTYLYQINPAKKGNLPHSLLITFEQDKAVLWANTDGSPAPAEAPLRQPAEQ